MIQLRPQGGGLPYSPFRDLVNCFPAIARKAAYGLAKDEREDWLENYLSITGTSDADLGVAVVAVAQFINQCRKPELDTVEETLKVSGLLSVPQPALLAMLAKIGQATLATYYGTSRDALRVDEKQLGLDALLATAEELRKEFSRASKK